MANCGGIISVSMKKTTTTLFRSLFRTDEGNIVLWQSPNPPLIAWIVLRVLAIILPNADLRSSASSLATIAISIWAYLELTDGVTVFRRVIGATVLVVITVSLLF